MSVIDFERIVRLGGEDVEYIDDEFSVALGPITTPGADQRTNLYDPDWGYFTVAESIKMDYVDDKTYTDGSEFAIHGIFTITAENSKLRNEVTDDDDTFDRVVAKYTALESLLRTASQAVAPVDFGSWGTATDPRCIPLPRPLLDKDGNRIYVLASELNVEPGQWGKFISYRCTLREAKFSPGKLTVNDYILDDAVVSIVLPSPVMARAQMVGCTGEVLQLLNWSMATYDISGTISGPAPSGMVLNDLAHEVMTSLSADKVDVGVVKMIGLGATEHDIIWPQLSNTDGTSVEVVHEEQVCTVSVRAVAGKI